MPKEKVAVTIDRDLLTRLDRMVSEGKYPSRSRAVEEAIRERLTKVERSRLATESAKLNPAFEQALADEGLAGDLFEWPEY
ncbi:MAG: ribbon-helix-helix domain-containing protein [Chloroflexota bacterium]|nr:ribbon-helix-helix domain-containing protein [Chloroflexota bacterium]